MDTSLTFDLGGRVLDLALAAATLFTCAVAQAAPETLTLTGPAFADGGLIPVKHTCDGSDLSPELHIAAVPAGAKSLALLCDDPDAPAGDWVHWLVFNIPPDTLKLPEGLTIERLHALGAVPGANSWGKLGYNGPCPPRGTHRYFFKLYALSAKLDLPSGATKARFLAEITGKILAETRLMGRYARL